MNHLRATIPQAILAATFHGHFAAETPDGLLLRCESVRHLPCGHPDDDCHFEAFDVLPIDRRTATVSRDDLRDWLGY